MSIKFYLEGDEYEADQNPY